MDIKTVALILLIGRLIAIAIMMLAIRRQWMLNKLPVREGLAKFRRNLNGLTAALLLMNLVPIIIDILTLITPYALFREDSPSVAGMIYAFSNCIFAIVSAAFVWTIYRQARNTIILAREDEEADS